MITGKTKICAILADPIEHVRTPERINALFERWGHDAVMVPIQVRRDQLRAVVATLRGLTNLAGFVVTVPHKSDMVDLCDEISEAARISRAVNVVRRTADGRLHGEIFDGIGFVLGLRQAGIEPAGKSAYIAGAGGAACAIAFALAEGGVARLSIHNRTPANVERLQARLADHFPDLLVLVGTGDPGDAALVVNATSLGLRDDDPLPFDASQLTPDQTVAEVIMKPATTRLLQAARDRGCIVQPGAPMLDCQLAMMARFMGFFSE